MIAYKKYLPESNISLASFDETNIPLKDNSLSYITSIWALGLSTVGRDIDRKLITIDGFQYIKEKQLLDEIFRVLKPGGCFITVENTSPEITYDCEHLNEYFYMVYHVR